MLRGGDSRPLRPAGRGAPFGSAGRGGIRGGRALLLGRRRARSRRGEHDRFHFLADGPRWRSRWGPPLAVEGSQVRRRASRPATTRPRLTDRYLPTHDHGRSRCGRHGVASGGAALERSERVLIPPTCRVRPERALGRVLVARGSRARGSRAKEVVVERRRGRSSCLLRGAASRRGMAGAHSVRRDRRDAYRPPRGRLARRGAPRRRGRYPCRAPFLGARPESRGAVAGEVRRALGPARSSALRADRRSLVRVGELAEGSPMRAAGRAVGGSAERPRWRWCASALGFVERPGGAARAARRRRAPRRGHVAPRDRAVRGLPKDLAGRGCAGHARGGRGALIEPRLSPAWTSSV